MRAIDYYELERYCIDRGLTCVPVEVIKSMADVEAEPVRYGHWKIAHTPYQQEGTQKCICSCCGRSLEVLGNLLPRCPYCGAKMRKEEK